LDKKEGLFLIAIRVKNLTFYYGNTKVLKDINLEIPEKKVIAIFGPSGCGKTTLLRVFNRLYELVNNTKIEGEVELYGKSIFEIDPVELRSKVGMVFQKPNPFPKSIYENVAFGLKLKGIRKREILDDKTEKALREAALWDEVKDKLKSSALELSGGQQQRLCIARALAVEPKVLLFDEPTSALDPIATAKIEDLMVNLSSRVTVIVVTHNMGQAARVSDYAAFLYMGELIEFGKTEKLFTTPEKRLTAEYLSGKFG
jgi:phosphate transport system ATP-binding protein